MPFTPSQSTKATEEDNEGILNQSLSMFFAELDSSSSCLVLPFCLEFKAKAGSYTMWIEDELNAKIGEGSTKKSLMVSVGMPLPHAAAANYRSATLYYDNVSAA